jgi:lipoate-protein ligase A
MTNNKMTDYPPTTWRLLLSAPTDGATNMATDEAILHSVSTGKAPPTLRFFAWEPPCLSLGRAQKVSDVDIHALQAAGFDLVRRPTGGRAILHIDELTYSVVAPETEPRVAGGILESYRRLSIGLVRGLERLGVPDIVADQQAARDHPKGPVCFEVPSDYEITIKGQKLVGSAQMRAQKTVLQHGTLLLHGDIARICPLLTAHPDSGGVRARATTVEAVLGKRIFWDEAAEALAAGFAETLNLHLEPGPLSAEEQAQAERLQAEKYTTDTWTRRV